MAVVVLLAEIEAAQEETEQERLQRFIERKHQEETESESLNGESSMT